MRDPSTIGSKKGQVALEVRELVVVRASRRSTFELRVEALDLRRGEALAVLGRNGAGKTTLLQALAGLEKPRSGHIHRAVSGAVTMVFQRPVAFAGNVWHNVRVGLVGHKLPRREVDTRVAEALARFGIEGLAERRASRLSGGELRRVALARAFALRPAVLLLDEPFDDLDLSAQESLSADLMRATRDTEVALGIVTHDLRRAALLADRMAVLGRGRLEQVDELHRVLHRPVSLEVARLVGMTNLIPGQVTGTCGPDRREIEVQNQSSGTCTQTAPTSGTDGTDAPEDREMQVQPGYSCGTHDQRSGTSRVRGRQGRLVARSSLPVGSRVWVGLRPERLKLALGKGEDGESLGSAVVRQVVSDSVLTTLTLDWNGIDLRTHLVSGRGAARRVTCGDVVALAAMPEDLHIMSRDPTQQCHPMGRKHPIYK